MSEPANVTGLLRAWREGDTDALERASSFVYAELHRIAKGYMSAERGGHTLQATALVNEAFMQLVDGQVDYESRKHFFVVAARMMRRILIDHARSKQRAKRGGGITNVTLDEGIHHGEAAPPGVAILELDEALSKLAKHDERMAQAVELIYFGGLSFEDAAEVIGVGRTQLFEDVRFAKAWLKQAMS